ncbi:LysR substrate-binding domain-containing protein [Catelliglobosispora koreensis]|uniref:LysR substrate-binding domain-containing protein n=1 Tax=Catelliglobosispora koreensis TaxID=129052 RepID=UPI000372D20D|nr:LysR substrate-binding domain-containing protein [Catelliglobosispora koreensis]
MSVFRLLVVPGVTVSKWSRTWSERLPDVELRLVAAEDAQAADELLASQADAGLIRLPVDMDTFHAISLYTEATVVVLPRDHALAEAEELTLAELAGETMLHPLDDVLTWTEMPATVLEHRPATTSAAAELAAASAGVLIVPQSLARLHHRRDLTYKVVTDAPASSVALVWIQDQQTDLVEEMIGIVRGRTANSSRGRGQTPAAPAEAKTRRAPKPAKGPQRRRGR